MSATRLTSCFLLVVILALSAGCDSKPRPDPLAGWKKWGTDAGYHLDKAITDDYQVYINKLPPQERERAKFKYHQRFCEDGTGQHAVEISVPLDGTW